MATLENHRKRAADSCAHAQQEACVAVVQEYDMHLSERMQLTVHMAAKDPSDS